MVHDCFCSATLEDLQLTLVGVSVGKPHINEFSGGISLIYIRIGKLIKYLLKPLLSISWMKVPTQTRVANEY